MAKRRHHCGQGFLGHRQRQPDLAQDQGRLFVGVLLGKNADIHITCLGKFLTAPVTNYSSRGGALQRYLTHVMFLISLSSVRGIRAKKPRKAEA